MADSDSEALAQFVSVTGANSEAASFFLDSAKGDVQTAIDQYFTSGGDMGIPQDMPGAAAAPRAQQAPGPAAEQQPAASASAAGRSRGAGGRGKQPATGGIRSLADLGGDDSSDDDENNEYYAGGEKSGQVVKAGPKDRDHKKRVEGLFDAAREHGAEDGTSADLADPAQAGPAAFSGRSRTLAGGEAPPAQAAPLIASQTPQTTTHTITFYANGIFTVDNGEGRSVLDAANADFVESIRSGTCPRELDPLDPSKHVTVNLVRNATDYVKRKYVAFGGQGQTLAGPSSSSSQPSTAASQISFDTQWEGVDESKPTTSLQLRLADGSRMVARFNHSQTVAHIRRFIAASRPDSARDYQLMTAFPQKQLPDDSATLEAAGLLGAVIIQR